MFVNSRSKREVLALAIANSVLFGSVDALFSGKKNQDEQRANAFVAVTTAGRRREDHVSMDKDGDADHPTMASSEDAAAVDSSTDNAGQHGHHASAVEFQTTAEEGRGDRKPVASGHDAGVLSTGRSFDLHAVPPVLRKGAFEDRKTSRRRLKKKAKSTKESSKKSSKSSAISISTEGCFTGSAAEVIQACEDAGASCCCSNGACDDIKFNYTESQACSWEGAPQTVCPGACNGEYACADYDDPQTETFIFGTGSCNGYSACYVFSGNVAENSCNGFYACEYRKGGDVDNNSCNGYRACEFGKGQIGKDSCNDIFACYYAYSEIGENACNGAKACIYQTSNKIATGTCNGADSCKSPPP
eukprot:CAMPEP_0119565328 /NCGR_PEP_ID=MMETSP1352-20130426/29617_1 /TAXON_ID=265584 /ORGANISM="Stauroneis constricta, Strain CCMP1120" /LENGTH=358 /DNA_ID=CAMNT_0007614209 /DNA_START=34 /DNA_END=1110 /DNA_ORIENTATION=+